MKSKHFVLSAFTTMLSLSVSAQAPQAFKYQSVVRDAAGNPMQTANVSVRATVHDITATGTILYQETFAATTNQFGLITLNIGTGTVVQGNFSTIAWGAGAKWMEIEADFGSGYVPMGTSQLLSVPYALYANTSPTTTGPTGPTGATGTAGTTGATGPSGTDGATGTAGTNGATGATGTDGTNGATGATGATGTAGTNGATGATGTDGTNGATGATGATGTAGTNGATGATGATGTAGTNGATGATGATGTAGTNGATGATGTAGTNGTTGATGATGTAGTNGATGATGATGTAGTNGATGATGATGTAGTNGTNGTTGATGATGTAGTNGTNGATGATGATGTAGTNGTNGTNGATGATGATGPLVSGTLDQTLRHDGATWVANGFLLNDGTNAVSIGTSINSIYRLNVYKQQLTANGDAQATIYGYRTRDSQNDGIDYSVSGTNNAIKGYNYWGDLYTFGVGGFSFNDYTRTGGVLGAQYGGAYWGSLGYKNSASTTYGVYGSNAYASGAGFMQSNYELAGVGGGFFGGLMGAWAKGELFGMTTSGSLYALYNDGNVYTEGISAQIVSDEKGKSLVYDVTSPELKVYYDSKGKLNNGSIFIEFNEEIKSLMKKGTMPTITLTALGECNGLFISQTDENGFLVKELQNGHSSVEFNYILIATRKEIVSRHEKECELLKPEFNSSLKNFMFNDNIKDRNAQPMWWDGSNIRFDAIPQKNDLSKKMEEEKRMNLRK